MVENEALSTVDIGHPNPHPDPTPRKKKREEKKEQFKVGLTYNV